MDTTALEAERPAPAAAASADVGRKAALYLGTVGAVVALDVVTKAAVEKALRLYEPVPVWGEVFRLTYIFNRGAAFGLHVGDSSRFIFLGLAVIAVLVLFFMYRSTPWSDRLRLIAIASVTGGAIGNLVDRVRSDRGVVDFLDFGLGTVRWPVFNVADIAVTVGAILLAISLWKEEQRNEHEERSAATG
ncbi:MAG: Lipoprotein signal peptidase [Gemmatimonadetes bacterium]|nr:Lipoprotein signal peptidase [Gemmatimonadota bacterium]